MAVLLNLGWVVSKLTTKGTIIAKLENWHYFYPTESLNSSFVASGHFFWVCTVLCVLQLMCPSWPPQPWSVDASQQDSGHCTNWRATSAMRVPDWWVINWSHRFCKLIHWALRLSSVYVNNNIHVENYVVYVLYAKVCLNYKTRKQHWYYIYKSICN